MLHKHDNAIPITWGERIALLIPICMTLLILNWFFNLTPYQGLQGAPLMLAPIAGVLGSLVALYSAKRGLTQWVKLGFAINCMLILLPFVYWFLGTWIFGI